MSMYDLKFKLAGWLLVAAAVVSVPVFGQVPAPTSAWLVYQEVQGTTTTIRAVPTATAQGAVTLAEFEHAPGWSGAVSIAPDSSMLAYVRITGAEIGRATTAQLWLFAFSTGARQLIDDDVDPLTPVVWSTGSAQLAYISHAADAAAEVGPITISNIRSHNKTTLPLLTIDHAPIGWVSEDAFLYETDSATSSRIVLREGEQSELVYEAPEVGAFRDFSFSEDHTKLLFLRTAGDWEVVSLDLRTRRNSVVARASSELYRPLFSPDGVLVTGPARSVPGQPALHARPFSVRRRAPKTSDSSAPAENSIVLSLSPDGHYEAIRKYEPPLADAYGVRDRLAGTVVWLPLLGSGDNASFVGWLGHR
jgi:hypothetical protein